MLFSQQTFQKWRQSMCDLARDFLQEQDFMERNLRQRGSKQLIKKCAMLDQLTKPTVHIEPVSSP
jgi:acid phosphatase class B